MLSLMALPLIRRPSAWLPLALAACALTLPWIALAVFGPDPTGDEGAAARLFQLFMALQVPAIAFFVAKWAIREPRQTAIVVLLQALAFVAALVPVYLLEHAAR
jgi:hypothetical protein